MDPSGAFKVDQILKHNHCQIFQGQVAFIPLPTFRFTVSQTGGNEPQCRDAAVWVSRTSTGPAVYNLPIIKSEDQSEGFSKKGL
jgi:hypothetical protein